MVKEESVFHNENRVSADQLERLLRAQLDVLEKTPALAKSLPPLMVWGPPGVGKSSIMRGVAESLGIGFIDVRLAQREPVDIRGLPVPTENGVVWQVSAEWPRDPKSRGIILFDEITAADRSLQVAAYEFILDRRLGNLYSVPDGWYICAAGNRVEDRAVAGTMSSALANRFMHVELQADVEDWVAWAVAQGLHPSVTGFIRYRPALLFHQEDENLERGWPT
ncbi:MAG: AAA family ATPase, partial [Kiritimatiellae bacterium]|nr:AAA family ATPase [Kiritimatiellia bacterium]